MEWIKNAQLCGSSGYKVSLTKITHSKPLNDVPNSHILLDRVETIQAYRQSVHARRQGWKEIPFEPKQGKAARGNLFPEFPIASMPENPASSVSLKYMDSVAVCYGRSTLSWIL